MLFQFLNPGGPKVQGSASHGALEEFGEDGFGATAHAAPGVEGRRDKFPTLGLASSSVFDLFLRFLQGYKGSGLVC